MVRCEDTKQKYAEAMTKIVQSKSFRPVCTQRRFDICAVSFWGEHNINYNNKWPKYIGPKCLLFFYFVILNFYNFRRSYN
jgi:hypothetical protein